MDEEVKVEEVQVEEVAQEAEASVGELPQSTVSTALPEARLASSHASNEGAPQAQTQQINEVAEMPAAAAAAGTPSVDSVDSSPKGGAGLRAEEPIAPVGGKDYAAGFRELVKEHPELVGKALPEEIFQAIVFGERSPLSVYEGMMMKKLSSENETLRKEIETLRQNAETAKKAPVKASTGQPKAEPVDEFLKGFNSRY